MCGPVIAVEPPARPAGGPVLAALAGRYWPRLALTYGLFVAENVLAVLIPLCLGLAIDSLLRGDRGGWWVVTAAYLGHLAISSARRVYDSRSFTAVYRDLAAEMVVAQRDRGVSVSRVATRSGLARSLVEFLENDLPQAMHTVCSLVGALVLLWFYDPAVAAVAGLLVPPCWLLNRWYRRRLAHHNKVLHDELEREVDVIRENKAPAVRDHYQRLGRTWVHLSDWEAFNIGIAQLLLVGLIAGSLLHLCRPGATSAGDVYAVLRYLLMLVVGMDGLPVFIRQWTRFQDIAARVQNDRAEDEETEP